MAQAPQQDQPTLDDFMNSIAQQSNVAPEQVPDLALLFQSATTNVNIAKERTQETAVEAGVNSAGNELVADASLSPSSSPSSSSYIVQPAQNRLVGTFSRGVFRGPENKTPQERYNIPDPLKSVRDKPTIPQELKPPVVDERQTVINQVEGKKGFNLAKEFETMSKAEGPDRVDRANMILQNIESQMGAEKDKIIKLANQQSGVNDAQAGLDNWIKLAAQKYPGRQVQQVDDARKALNDAMIVSDKYTKDLIAASPVLRELTGYRDHIGRDLTFTMQGEGQRRQRQDARDAKREDIAAKITPVKSLNGRFALELNKPENNADELKTNETIYNAAKEDPALQLVLGADRTNIVSLLIHPNAEVRTYAYKIIKGMETEYAQQSQSDPNVKVDPFSIDNVRSMGDLAANPTKWIAEHSNVLPPDMVKKAASKEREAIGKEAQHEVRVSNQLNMVTSIIDTQFRRSKDDISKWKHTDPQIKQIIDSMSHLKKDGSVNMGDGISAIVNTEIKREDGTILTLEDKRQALLASLTVTLGNDPKSFIKPISSDYEQDFRFKVNNLVDKAWVRKTIGISSVNKFILAPVIDSLESHGYQRK
jgi:two-component sensor histidine kinase